MASQVCLATTTFDLTAPQQMLRMRSKYAEMAYFYTPPVFSAPAGGDSVGIL